MIYQSVFFENLNVIVKIASFDDEYYISAEITMGQEATSTEHQHNSLEKAIAKAQETFFSGTVLVWKRLFVSDIINHKKFLKNDTWSVVQQAPLNGSKISAIAYFVDKENSKVERLNNDIILTRPNYTHIFSGRIFSKGISTAEQTTEIFNKYLKKLTEHKLTLTDNTIRTWIYVKDIDSRYADMVSARNKIFDNVGLTSGTHSIASTGIEGRYFHPQTFVLMDAYSANVSKEQITFLKAETNLNSTHEYGVSFERGTAIDYANRRHIFISGTASINNKGEIVAVNNIEKQIERTIENINELLKEGKVTMKDLAHFIVYLRDSGDYSLVNNYFLANYPNIPYVIVHAPVCRPGWLIEIECIAIAPVARPYNKKALSF